MRYPVNLWDYFFAPKKMANCRDAFWEAAQITVRGFPRCFAELYHDQLKRIGMAELILTPLIWSGALVLSLLWLTGPINPVTGEWYGWPTAWQVWRETAWIPASVIFLFLIEQIAMWALATKAANLFLEYQAFFEEDDYEAESK